MANNVEKSCTMLVYSDKQPSINEIKEALESGDTQAKVLAMQRAVTLLLNGEQLPALFITIVRYVLPSEDHTVQKLLLLYLVRLRVMGQRAREGVCWRSACA
jgi:coatomer subunit beta